MSPPQSTTTTLNQELKNINKELRALRARNNNAAKRIQAASRGLRNRRLVKNARRSTCSICFEQNGKINTLTRCGHAFHKECLKQWTDLQGTCPMCRMTLANPRLASAPPERNGNIYNFYNPSASPYQTSEEGTNYSSNSSLVATAASLDQHIYSAYDRVESEYSLWVSEGSPNTFTVLPRRPNALNLRPTLTLILQAYRDQGGSSPPQQESIRQFLSDTAPDRDWDLRRVPAARALVDAIVSHVPLHFT